MPVLLLGCWVLLLGRRWLSFFEDGQSQTLAAWMGSEILLLTESITILFWISLGRILLTD